MIHSAFILLASFSATWMVVVGLLVVVTLVSLVMLLLKSREVSTLKKEVEELRDTMRMMRYEELNLSRMLHTADKGEEAPLLSPQMGEEEGLTPDPSPEERGTTDIAEEESLTPNPSPEERGTADIAEEESLTPDPSPEERGTVDIAEEESLTPDPSPEERGTTDIVEEESLTPDSSPEERGTADIAEEEEEAPLVEEPVEPMASMASIDTIETINTAAPELIATIEPEPIDIVESIASIEPPIVPATQKQAINERRPAIPNDLFAAWFAENDDPAAEEEAPQEGKPSLVEEPVDAPVESMASIDAIDTVEPVALSVEAAPLEAIDARYHAIDAAPLTEKAVGEAPTVPATTESPVPAAESQEELGEQLEAKEVVSMSKEDERFCRKLERLVNTRMRNPNLNIDVIAAQFGIGRTNFYRKVRELMGMSPNDYLRQCRMERAAELLRTTTLPVADICAQVGMPDAQYFSRVFKSFFGTPPSAYREQESK